MVSLALGSFDLSAMLCAKIHAITISKMGRKNAVMLGYFLLIVSLCGIGTLDMLPKDNWRTFYSFLLLLRFLGGYADSLAFTTQNSIIQLTFSENKDECMGLVAAAVGFGIIVGLPIGAILYGFFGYQKTFYILAVFPLFGVLNSALFIPSQLNAKQQKLVSLDEPDKDERIALVEDHLKAQN